MFRRHGIIMDVHGPFEHKRRYDCMMNSFAGNGLDSLVIIGDFLDFYSVSRYGKHPGVLAGLQAEIEWANNRLDEIDKTFPGIPKCFIEGNHEARLESYICDKAPALFGITEVRRLLKMYERPDWKWFGYGPKQRVQLFDSNLFMKHDPGPGSALMLPKNLGVSLCHGHTHRRTEASHRTLDDRVNRVFSGGWLGDELHDKVFGYVKGHFLWEPGFVYVETEGKEFNHSLVQFDSNNSVSLNGKRYR